MSESKEVTMYDAGGVPVSQADLLKGLEQYEQAIPDVTGDPFMKLHPKDGVFCFGADETEVDSTSRWAMNPVSLEHGWVCWHDGEVQGEVMVPFTQPRPMASELPDLGHKWDEQRKMVLKCVKGAHKGTQVIYKTTSKGFSNAIKELTNALKAQLKANPQQPVPILSLEVDSYKHPDYGKTYVPIFGIDDWCSFQELMDYGEASSNDSGQDESEQEEQKEETGGTSRRRRRA